MNKIYIDNHDIIIDNNDTYFIEIDKDYNIDIIIKEDIKCKIIMFINNHSLCNINYILNKNSYLEINSLSNNNSININIDLKCEYSEIIYNYSIISNIDSINNIKIHHNSKNTKSIIKCNGINLDNNKLHFNIDSYIYKDSILAESNELCKIINIKNGDSKIIPNFIIDNNDIVANHSAYIGKFNDDIIFYMKSRGINDQELYKLLYRGLLLGNMNLLEEKELFNNKLKEWGLYE